MNLFYKVLGVLSLPIAIYSAVMAGITILGDNPEGYKIGFFVLLFMANLRTFLDYLAGNFGE